MAYQVQKAARLRKDIFYGRNRLTLSCTVFMEIEISGDSLPRAGIVNLSRSVL